MACILVFVGFTACSRPIVSQSELLFGTICNITLFDRGRPQVYRDIFRRLGEIERKMSVFIQGSDVDRINMAAGVEAVRVQDDVFELIERALYYAELSWGAFDPTVGPLVALWDLNQGTNGDFRIPSQDEIDGVLPLINWRNVELDRVNKTVFLKNPGMAIDLGAIAKGYAADEAAFIIQRAGIPRAIIDLGGNILFVGLREDRGPWRVGIQDPLEHRGAYMGIAQVHQQTVVTSGVYERYVIADGVQYHHIFLPSNGYPVRNGLFAVTIIGDNSMEADALSTAVFVLGYERGRALIEALEGVEAIFVFEDMSIGLTAGADFILTDNRYTIDF